MASLAKTPSTLSEGFFFFFPPSQKSPFCPISVPFKKKRRKRSVATASSSHFNPSLNPSHSVNPRINPRPSTEDFDEGNNGSQGPRRSPLPSHSNLSPSPLLHGMPNPPLGNPRSSYPLSGKGTRLGSPPTMPARYRKSVQRRRLARRRKPLSRKLSLETEDSSDDSDGNCAPRIEASDAQSLGTLENKPHMEWNLPFEFQYSYTETPKVEPIGYREPQFSLFGPTTMPRPWQGGRPRNPSKKKLPEFDSFNPPPPRKKGVKYVQNPGPFPLGQGPKEAHTREEIQGEPLSGVEVKQLIDSCRKERRRVTLGRDGLTHNMLDLIHSHWKRRRVCKVKCLGVPTVDMDNLCFHLEDKTGGKIIYRVGGMVYLFRGRYYNYKDRPKIPLVLFKPASPIYPRLIEPAPAGLTKEEAVELRRIGRKVEPLCKIGKNGVCSNLVGDIRSAFKVDKLVRINCEELNPSDCKKLGAKLRDLVPCVLLSFKQGHILMGRARDMEEETHLRDCLDGGSQSVLEGQGGALSEEGRGSERVLQTDLEANKISSDGSSSFSLGLSPKKALNRNRNYAYVYSQRAIEKVNALWSEALENGVAFTIEEGAALDSDSVLMKVEEFAKVAPPGPVYICQAERIRERQKLLHQIKVDPPSLEELPMGELPLDNLAQLLVS